MAEKMRLNRFLACCGLGSRRKVEKFIEAGDVRVNGEPVTLACKVDPENDLVTYRGEPVVQSGVLYYVMLNKPKGYITSVGDPLGRPTIVDLIHDKYWKAGVFPVGRLDKDTEGLLLLTNDGFLAQALMHPSSECKKKYIVSLDRSLEEEDKAKIEKGLRLREFKTGPCSIEYISEQKHSVYMTISEGKKRQIRVSFKKFDYKVKRLIRISLGPLVLGNLHRGMFRDLRPIEIKKLKKYFDKDK
ncbi:MAG: rRNA pseudouridine synthase [Spirochaetes bacterium]|nr:rRNA pseudouridine synthase [Spirochaetota bacterium]MBN2770198.1 rRNA pseudouridine synthase [Spirochaetota bacterium]